MIVNLPARPKAWGSRPGSRPLSARRLRASTGSSHFGDWGGPGDLGGSTRPFSARARSQADGNKEDDSYGRRPNTARARLQGSTRISSSEAKNVIKSDPCTVVGAESTSSGKSTSTESMGPSIPQSHAQVMLQAKKSLLAAQEAKEGLKTVTEERMLAELDEAHLKIATLHSTLQPLEQSDDVREGHRSKKRSNSPRKSPRKTGSGGKRSGGVKLSLPSPNWIFELEGHRSQALNSDEEDSEGYRGRSSDENEEGGKADNIAASRDLTKTDLQEPGHKKKLPVPNVNLKQMLNENQMRSEALKRSVMAIESLSAALDATNAEKQVMEKVLQACAVAHETAAESQHRRLGSNRTAQAFFISQLLPGTDRKVVERLVPGVLDGLEGALRLNMSFAESVAKCAELEQKLNEHVLQASLHQTSAMKEETDSAAVQHLRSTLSQVRTENERLRCQLADAQQELLGRTKGSHGGRWGGQEGAAIVVDMLQKDLAATKAQALHFQAELAALTQRADKAKELAEQEKELLREELASVYNQMETLKKQLSDHGKTSSNVDRLQDKMEVPVTIDSQEEHPGHGMDKEQALHGLEQRFGDRGPVMGLDAVLHHVKDPEGENEQRLQTVLSTLAQQLTTNYNEIRAGMRLAAVEGSLDQGVMREVRMLQQLISAFDAQLTILQGDEGFYCWRARHAAWKADGVDDTQNLSQLASRLEEQCVEAEMKRLQADAFLAAAANGQSKVYMEGTERTGGDMFGEYNQFYVAPDGDNATEPWGLHPTGSGNLLIVPEENEQTNESDEVEEEPNEEEQSDYPRPLSAIEVSEINANRAQIQLNRPKSAQPGIRATQASEVRFSVESNDDQDAECRLTGSRRASSDIDVQEDNNEEADQFEKAAEDAIRTRATGGIVPAQEKENVLQTQPSPTRIPAPSETLGLFHDLENKYNAAAERKRKSLSESLTPTADGLDAAGNVDRNETDSERRKKLQEQEEKSVRLSNSLLNPGVFPEAEPNKQDSERSQVLSIKEEDAEADAATDSDVKFSDGESLGVPSRTAVFASTVELARKDDTHAIESDIVHVSESSEASSDFHGEQTRHPTVFYPDSGNQEDRDTISAIMDGRLYLTNFHGVERPEELQSLGITHIVCVNEQENTYNGQFKYLNISALEDQEDHDPTPHFEAVKDFTERAVREGGAVCFHCAAGISRSSTMMIAYLMAAQQMSLLEAFTLCYRKRRVVWPNQTFIFHLVKYEKELQERGILPGNGPSITLEEYAKWSGGPRLDEQSGTEEPEADDARQEFNHPPSRVQRPDDKKPRRGRSDGLEG